MATKKPTITNHRNSETGKFVTEKYAKQHPKNTETEHNPRPAPPSKSAQKK